MLCADRVFFQIGQHLHAIHAGHDQIEDEDIDRMSVQFMQALLPVGGTADDLKEVTVLQIVLHFLDHFLAVIHQVDLQLLFHFFPTPQASL